MPGMDLLQLQEAITAQLKLGKHNIDHEDWYLFEINILDLMAEPVDCIRGWLCDMLIARGEIEAAKEESVKDRSSATINSTQISNQQRKEFMNWRNIKLS